MINNINIPGPSNSTYPTADRNLFESSGDLKSAANAVERSLVGSVSVSKISDTVWKKERGCGKSRRKRESYAPTEGRPLAQLAQGSRKNTHPKANWQYALPRLADAEVHRTQSLRCHRWELSATPSSLFLCLSLLLQIRIAYWQRRASSPKLPWKTVLFSLLRLINAYSIHLHGHPDSVNSPRGGGGGDICSTVIAQTSDRRLEVLRSGDNLVRRSTRLGRSLAIPRAFFGSADANPTLV